MRTPLVKTWPKGWFAEIDAEIEATHPGGSSYVPQHSPATSGNKSARAAAAAARDVPLAAKVLARGIAPDSLLPYLQARVAYPDDTIAELGARIGASKDAVRSALRRALALLERVPAE